MGDNIFGFGSERWCAELFIIAMNNIQKPTIYVWLKGDWRLQKSGKFSRLGLETIGKTDFQIKDI